MTFRSTPFCGLEMQRAIDHQTAWRERWWTRAMVVVMLVHTGMLSFNAWCYAPTFDEPGHMVAGLSHIEFGTTDLYRVNPPLARIIATIPVFVAGPELVWETYNPGLAVRQELALGSRFIRANGEDSRFYFFLARLACIPFSLLGAWVCRIWAAELYGDAAGFAALCLWSFSPNMLGHGALLTPDIPAAAMGVTALYWYQRWLSKTETVHSLIAGVVLGLALATKTTWVLLFALYPLAWAIAWSFRGSPPGGARAGRSSAELCLLLFVALLTVNAVYGFGGTLTPLGDFQFRSDLLTGRYGEKTAANAIGNRFTETFLAGVPVPLPFDMVDGVDLQKVDFEKSQPAYLRGHWQDGGWWYYYLYAMAIKVPMGTLALLGFTTVSFFRRRPQGSEWMLTIAALLLLFVISGQPGINKHLRYLYPAFPMLFILATRAFSFGWLARRCGMGCVVVTVVGSLHVYPHSLSFFNALVGGPRHGAEHLLNSNISWGQDSSGLVAWARKYPERRPLYAALHASYDPAAIGIPFELPYRDLKRNSQVKGSDEKDSRRQPPPGWYAIDVNVLHAYPHPSRRGDSTDPASPDFWTKFRQQNPVDQIGYSIYIYHVQE